jgi:hypothetical protein
VQAAHKCLIMFCIILGFLEAYYIRLVYVLEGVLKTHGRFIKLVREHGRCLPE